MSINELAIMGIALGLGVILLALIARGLKPASAKNVRIPRDAMSQPTGGQAESPYPTSTARQYGPDELQAEIIAAVEWNAKHLAEERQKIHNQFNDEVAARAGDYFDWHYADMKQQRDEYRAKQRNPKLADGIIDGEWSEADD